MPPTHSSPPSPAAVSATAPSPRDEIGHSPGAELWVFAYGSLMWNPGFPALERQAGLVRGWHRRFCIYSHHHRGTPAVPGAVLGLDRGGSCRGVAFRVAGGEVDRVLDYLWAREMVNRVYVPRQVPVLLAGGGRVTALTFTADRGHGQYCGRLGADGTARLIRQGVGISGRAVDYLASLLAHLAALGIRDRGLLDLARRVGDPD